MPQVPRVTPAVKEQPGGMPASRPMVSAKDLSQESRALADLGSVLGDIADAGAQIVVEENRQAAKDAMIAYDNGIKSFESDATQNRKLGNAKGLVDDWRTYDEKLSGDVTKNLSPAQKRIFAKQSKARQLSAERGIANYQLGQLRANSEQTNKVLLGSTINEAVTAPDDMSTEVWLTKGMDLIRDQARLGGWSGERVQLEVKNMERAVYGGRLDAMVQNKRWDASKEYLDKHREAFEPSTVSRAEQMIDAGLKTEEIQSAADIEFNRLLEAGDGSPYTLDYLDRMESLEDSYSMRAGGDFGAEVRKEVEAKAIEWERAQNRAVDADYKARVKALNELERVPNNYQAAKEIGSSLPRADARAAWNDMVDKTFGPDAFAHKKGSLAESEVSTRMVGLLQAGRAGDLNDPQNVDRVYAQLRSYGNLSKDAAMSVIEQARNDKGISYSAVKTAVGRATGNTKWLQEHPTVWDDVYQASVANPGMTTEDAVKMAINASVAVSTSDGDKLMSDVLKDPDAYSDVMIDDLDEALAVGTVSQTEYNLALSYLKDNDVPPTEGNISRRIAQHRIDSHEVMMADLERKLSAPPGFFSLSLSPGVSFSADQHTLPAYDSASEGRKSEIESSYAAGLPQQRAVQMYGTPALEYYEAKRWEAANGVPQPIVTNEGEPADPTMEKIGTAVYTTIRGMAPLTTPESVGIDGSENMWLRGLHPQAGMVIDSVSAIFE